MYFHCREGLASHVAGSSSRLSRLQLQGITLLLTDAVMAAETKRAALSLRFRDEELRQQAGGADEGWLCVRNSRAAWEQLAQVCIINVLHCWLHHSVLFAVICVVLSVQYFKGWA